MTSQFTTTNLVGNRVLVNGTDVNGIVDKIVLDGTQFVELKGNSAHELAHNAFNEAVKEFYLPLTEAADALQAAHEGVDDIFTEVIAEAVEPTFGQARRTVTLTPDTVILRRIEAGDTDGLIWVGGKLEIAA